MPAMSKADRRQGSDVVAQREAMRKLDFLVGTWSGDASVARGPGEPLRLTQTEHVQRKLDGLVLLVEGTGRDRDGRVVFQALATLTYDDVTGAYRIRAHSDGNYLDTELSVSDDGFAWSFEAGPARVRNAMSLNANGEWVETTETTVGSSPAHRSMEMTLRRQS
jgi:hypothetical protein